MTTRPEKLRDLLEQAPCAMCPNPIGADAEYAVLDNPDIVDALSQVTPDRIIEGPDGPMIIVHVRCLENAALVQGATLRREE